jgi:hypothetical protein
MTETVWTVFKANLLSGAVMVAGSMAVTAVIFWFRRRRWQKMKPVAVDKGPKVFVFGAGENPTPGHCPLCGQGWAMPGPTKPEVPATQAGP